MTDEIATSAAEAKVRSPRRPGGWVAGVAAYLFASTGRCHAVGGVWCAIGLGTTIWLLTQPNLFLRADGDRSLALADAVTLLAQADDWRQKYAEHARAAESLHQRAEAIANWLPATVHWTTLEDQVRQQAANCQIEIVSLQTRDQQVGSRVGVALGEVRLKGSYLAICQFAQQLAFGDAMWESKSAEPRPDVQDEATAVPPIVSVGWQAADRSAIRPYRVWCSRIRMQRLPVLIDGEVICAATMMLRVPYAADGSAAANIIPPEIPDA